MLKKTLLIAMLLISGVVAASCQDLMEQDKYVDAGDCHKEAEQWNDCLYNYLKAARKAEKKYLPMNEQGERHIADNSEKPTALYYYNPSTAKVNTCLSNSDYYDLKPKMDQYYDWLMYYATNPVKPPFNVETEVIEVMEEVAPEMPPEENISAPTENETEEGCFCAEYWDPVCGVNGETYSNKCFAECDDVKIVYKGECEEDKAENKTQPETEEQEDDTSLLFIGVVSAIIVIGLAALLLSRKKKDVFVCSECGKEFDSERGLKIHVGKKHNKD